LLEVVFPGLEDFFIVGGLGVFFINFLLFFLAVATTTLVAGLGVLAVKGFVEGGVGLLTLITVVGLLI
jgi:hypothetical protein